MDLNVVLGIGAFLVVAGYAGLERLRHGRDPAYLDDASILLPAPPPGMTAATATMVAGGGTHVAFMAALLDLASRDELAFVAEDRPDRVGIAFRGGETADPRVLLNRRNPIGEAETWLLGELKASLAIAARRGSNDDDAPPSPEMVAAGMQMFGQPAANERRRGRRVRGASRSRTRARCARHARRGVDRARLRGADGPPDGRQGAGRARAHDRRRCRWHPRCPTRRRSPRTPSASPRCSSRCATSRSTPEEHRQLGRRSSRTGRRRRRSPSAADAPADPDRGARPAISRRRSCSARSSRRMRSVMAGSAGCP